MIRVLDKDLKFVDFLRKYTFSQFQRCFRDVGTFQIDAKLVDENKYLLNRKEQFFILFGFKDFGIVDRIEKEADNEYEKNIKIMGRMSSVIFTKRVVFKTFKYKGSSSVFVKNLILSNMVESQDKDRNLAIAVEFLYDDVLKQRESNISKSVTGGYVWDAISEILELDKLGIVLHPIVKPKMTENDINIEGWKAYISPGVDRTKHNPFNNEAVVFSQSLSNIKTTDYYTNAQDYRNVVYIAGEGEGSDRKWFQKNINQADSKGMQGWNRSEMWIDARDIQSEDEEGNVIPDEEYQKLIDDRINERSEEGALRDEYNATIVQENELYTYEKDYDVGDFVTVVDNELGVEIDAQIVKAVISEEKGQKIVDIVLSYGNVEYDLTKQVKQNKVLSEENKTTIMYLENQLKRSGGGSGGGGTPGTPTDIDDITVSFEDAESLLSLNNGDTVSRLFGKISKWYKSFANVEFSGRYEDLLNKPSLFSGNYNDLTNKPSIPTIPTYNGAVSTVLNQNLTSEKVVVSNASGKIIASNITTEQLSFLEGLTGNIQEQIDNIDSGGGGTPLSGVVDLEASGRKESTEIRWKDPEDIVFNGEAIAEFDGTKVVRNSERYPIGVDDGEVAVDSKVRNQYSDTPFVDQNLVNDTTYYYTLFPYTKKGVYTYSDKNKTQAMPLDFDVVLANNTWDQIAEASMLGLAPVLWKCGDKKDGYAIYGFNHDNLADGSGKAGITFIITEEREIYNSSWSSENRATYYANSNSKKWLNETMVNETNKFYPGAGVVENAKEVKKVCANAAGSRLVSYNDKFFLFSPRELGVSFGLSSGTAYEGAASVKLLSGDCWTRDKAETIYAYKIDGVSKAVVKSWMGNNTPKYMYGFCI